MTEQHDLVHDVGHDHDARPAHPHPPAQPDDTSPPGPYELMILAIRDLLIEKGVLKPDQIRRGLETLDSWQPSRGADIVARAWTDLAFKRRLLADGNEAVADFGIDMGGAKLTAGALAKAAEIVSVEGRHAGWISAILGEAPAPRAADPGLDAGAVMAQLKATGFLG